MGKLNVCCDGTVSVTAISNCFIDEYMPEANGEFVKVYLYLLRATSNPTMDCSVSAIADCFDHTEKDILRALHYWERQNALRLEYDETKKVTGIMLLSLSPKEDYAAPVAPVTPIATATPIAPVMPAPSIPTPVVGDVRKEYTPEEILGFKENPDISELFYVVEAYMRKPLTDDAINTILFWLEDLEFSTELVDYLVEYCINKGHTSFRYMDKIALDWHEKQITTVAAAKADTESYNKVNFTIMKAFGIVGRDLAKSEKQFITRWTDEWRFSLSIIEEACRRTIDATHQPSFAYADKVLASWFENGVTQLDDIKRLDDSFSRTRKISIQTSEPAPIKRKKFGDFERKNNYDQLEQLLIKPTAQ